MEPRPARPFASPLGSGSGTRRPTGTSCRAPPPTRPPGRRRRARQPDRASSTSPSASTSPGSTSFPPDHRVHRPRLVARPRAGRTRSRNGDLSPFHADVDFGKLARRASTTTCTASPRACRQTGPMDRILASHFETEQGADYSTTCGAAPPTARASCAAASSRTRSTCRKKPAPARRLRPHAAPALARRQLQPVRRHPQPVPVRRARPGLDRDHPRGPRPRRLVLRPRRRRHLRGLGRRRPPLPPRPGWTAISGYSMGGYGTYKFADPVPGPVRPRAADRRPTGARRLGAARRSAARRRRQQHEPHARLGSQHPVPDLGRRPRTSWCRCRAPSTQAQTFDDLGYRYEFDLFTAADHFALAVNDQYAPAADFLGTHAVDRNPPHVTYVVNPTMDFPEAGTVADHAYWLSGLEAARLHRRRAAGAGRRALDAFGRGDPAKNPTQTKPRSLPGGQPGRHCRTWSDRRVGAPRRRRPLGTSSISTSRTSLRSPSRPRGRVSSCHSTLDVTTDGPLTVTLAGCGRTLHFGGP